MIFRSVRSVAAASALATVVVTLAACGSTPTPPPQTVEVEPASVSTGVSATGSVSAAAQNNLGFPKGGQLTAVNVKVGDAVKAGQVLATVDNFSALQELKQAQAALAGQQANLLRAETDTGPEGAQNSLNQAGNVVAATKRVVDATSKADDRAVSQAQDAYDKAQAGAAAATAKLTADTTTCTAYQTAAAAAMSGGPAVPPATAGAGQVACTMIPGDQTAVTMAQTGVGQAQGTLDQARAKRDLDRASGQLQIQQAQSGTVQAQNGVDASDAGRSPTLDAARAGVDGAKVGVANAQRDLANTTLRAPVDGRITALNGGVGEYLAPSSGTTPFAPGSDAAIPGAQAASGASAAAGASAASPTRPGGTQFLVMQGVSGFSVVAPFQEDDAANMAPGQHVDLQFDAIPDAALTGTVVSVAPSATEISSVINYYVTIAVNQPDQRLRDGQTAQATVITGEAPNMLSVPNSAVIRQGDKTSVVVLEPDGRQVPTPFSAGLVGADRTEVTGGLKAGDQVLVTGNR